jgi:hypothetical protein
VFIIFVNIVWHLALRASLHLPNNMSTLPCPLIFRLDSLALFTIFKVTLTNFLVFTLLIRVYLLKAQYAMFHFRFNYHFDLTLFFNVWLLLLPLSLLSCFELDIHDSLKYFIVIIWFLLNITEFAWLNKLLTCTMALTFDFWCSLLSICSTFQYLLYIGILRIA